MDWSRAKSIFIVSFLALNLLLGYELWIGKWNAIDDSRESAADVVQELGRIMSSRGIKLTAVVPKETPRMQELTVKRVEGMSDGQMVRLSEPIRSNLFFNKSSLKEMSGRIVPKLESYSYDPVTSNDRVLMMTELAGDYPLFDVNLELYVTNGNVTGFRQSYVDTEKSEDKEEKKVISANTVLRTLSEKYLQYGSVVTDIRLGYHGQFFETEQWTTLPMFPTWRVAIDNGDIYYVQGFRGDVETAASTGDRP